MACHERYCASRSPGGMATSGRAMAAASTAMKMAANRRRRGWKTASDRAAKGKSLTAAPRVMLTAAPTGRRASNATNARIISAATSVRGRAKVFIILLVTESPIYVEIEEGYGREAVRAAVLRSWGVGRRCRVG